MKLELTQAEFFARWTLIDTLFSEWWSNTETSRDEDWKYQQKFLSQKMKKHFRLDKKSIDNIFRDFLEMFPDIPDIIFDWKSHQLPVLQILTAKALERKNVK